MSAPDDGFLDGVIGAVEATGYERHALWKEAQEQSREWIEFGSGLFLTIGHCAGMPTTLELWKVVVGGHKIVFFNSPSKVTDHRLVDEWLAKYMPDSSKDETGRVNRTDAMNFHNIFPREKTMSAPARTDGFDLDAIKPARGGDKYSPNLYRHMKAMSPLERALVGVYRSVDSPKTLYLGRMDRGYFIGARLYEVLCHGKRQTFCYVRGPSSFKEVKGFWSRYTKIGCCAIDPAHSRSFVGDETRWRMAGATTRHCQWCGRVTQRKRRWTEVERKKREAWESRP